MRALPLRSENTPSPNHAPRIIGAGLVILMAATWWPRVPIVTAVALVALGATIATRAKFRGLGSAVTALWFHIAVYGALYTLVVGAALHRAAQGSPAFVVLTTIDIAVSLWPVAAASRLVCDGLFAAHWSK